MSKDLLISDPKSKDFWKFTHFTSDSYKYREKWDEYNPLLKEELMLITYNIAPLLGIEYKPGKSTHFGSANSWYMYKRYDIWESQGVSKSWLIEVHPTAENPERPYAQAHMKFEVIKPNV